MTDAFTADFLIIGGGIAGISAAARLSHLGRVILLEAEDSLAHHASGRSAAAYEPYYGLQPVVDLSLASGDHLRAIPHLVSPRGMMMLGKDGEAADTAAGAKVYKLDPISVDEARQIVPILNPDIVKHVAIGMQAWDIDTDLLIQSFAREAKSNGAQILPKSRVTAIARSAAGWQVTGGGAQYNARLLINASGAWVDIVAELAGVAPLGFQPYRRSMARIPAPGGHDLSKWPMLHGVGETWYAKPDAGALIVSPAEEHPMDPHDAWADDMVLAEGLARYEEMVTEPVTRLISNWAGLRTFSPDRVLVIGPDVTNPDFFWLGGQGGYGFQSCAAASQLVADLIAGRTPSLSSATVAALSPARFSKG